MSGILSFARDVNVVNSCIVTILPVIYRLLSGSNKDPSSVFCIYSVHSVCKSHICTVSLPRENTVLAVVILSTIVSSTNLRI